ncbi:hypothetical protein ACFFX1_09175 [Dactylosporangium sucinum]|uniref:Uncharacterized protein n=1 Tax=Dactylosporangium sucinum TaxID=1424081 RepID=A0A917TII5_9ACTN|nr:hypothetical protein [Dactylosporangium sucinum]GGM24747.1 hypothetical protein GCM10007977_027330 [Dactylosporangium sucinum]
MFKLNRGLPAIGAAALLATLIGAPAHAAGTGGGGGATFSAGKVKRAGSAVCREMTVNGGFELPKLGAKQNWYQFDEDDVQGWRTDDPDGKIEIWGGGNGVPARFGKQFAELNATGSGNSVYQDIKTKPNTKIYWSFWIRARDTSGGKDVDATQIHFGRTPKNDGSVNGVGSTFAYANSASDVQWKRLYGWYKTGPGQTSTRVTLTAVESASTDEGYGNLVDGLTIVEHQSCI